MACWVRGVRLYVLGLMEGEGVGRMAYYSEDVWDDLVWCDAAVFFENFAGKRDVCGKDVCVLMCLSLVSELFLGWFGRHLILVAN